MKSRGFIVRWCGVPTFDSYATRGAPVASQNLNLGILMMQTAENRDRHT